MADQEKALPIRSEQDADERVQTKIVDATTPTQQMEVDTDGNAHAEVHGNDPGGTDRVLRTSEQGSASVDGEYHASNNTDPSSVGLVGLVRNASPADAQQTLRLTAIENGSGDVRAMDVSIRDESGEPFSESNPLPVFQTENPGTEVHDYSVATVTQNGGTSNHDYSVANNDVFQLKKIIGAASVRGKLELQIGDGAASEVFTTKAVKFISESTLGADIDLDVTLQVTGTVNTTTVRVVRTNLDKNDDADMYTTIVGITK